MRILILISIFLSGCAVYKLKPDLDHRFSQHGQILAENSRLIMRVPDDKYRNRLSNSGLIKNFKGKGKSKVEVVEIIDSEQHGFQCGHAFLEVVSLGIIPVVCDRNYMLTIDYFPVENAQPERSKLSFTETAVAGWVSLFLAPFSGWEFDNEKIERAMYTVINKRANQ